MPKVSQREIVFCLCNLPQGPIEHPVIVVSSRAAIDHEVGYFTGIMCSSDGDKEDMYSFWIQDKMYEASKKMPSRTQVRLHITVFADESHIKPTGIKIKQDYFDEILQAQYERVVQDLE